MKVLEKLFKRIIQRTNINLRELEIDVTPYVKNIVPFTQMLKFYAFYGISPNHPLDMEFKHSSLSGSYFLGKCRVKNSILYKSDIRGDELKKKGDAYQFKKFNIAITDDEGIEIEDSFLVKTLVHNYSHDPETLEKFYINDAVSLPYANIHGSPTSGCFLGPFSTVDLTTVSDCVIGAFSYIQAGEISHMNIGPGTVWVKSGDDFNFLYVYPTDRLKAFISLPTGSPPRGLLMDFVENHKEAFQQVFDMVNVRSPVYVPKSASLDRYAVTRHETHISDNVLVSQRAFLENAWLGMGANAQENCYIINSRLEGYNVTAHGAKIINAELGKKVFVGFNSFLNGNRDYGLRIGEKSIVMPHTIIDLTEPVNIGASRLVWGCIRNQEDVAQNTMALSELASVSGKFSRGRMKFQGNGEQFIKGFQHRIEHILEANGAYCDGKNMKGHAQSTQNISYNLIQPYPEGDLKGIFPRIDILP